MLPVWKHFSPWRPIFVGPHNVICFMSTCWHIEFRIICAPVTYLMWNENYGERFNIFLIFFVWATISSHHITFPTHPLNFPYIAHDFTRDVPTMYTFTAIHKVHWNNVNYVTPHALLSVFTKLTKWFILNLVVLVCTKICLVNLIFMQVQCAKLNSKTQQTHSSG